MATTLVRWPHDVHIAVTAELSKRLGVPAGRLLHVSAGEVFEMDAAEAAARIEAGDVLAVAEKPKKAQAEGAV